MKAAQSSNRTSRTYLWAAVPVVALAVAYTWVQPTEIYAAEESLLGGKVTSASGEALAGVPRLYKIDMRTGQSIEYFMPLPYEIRDLTADEGAERPTVWIPAYRAPSKMVKVQIY